MSYSNRIWIYGPVGLLVLVIVLYAVFWRVQADMLAARLDGANGGEIVPGVVFAFAEKSVGGFPFRLDAVLSGVTFSNRGPDGETAWRTEQLALHTMAYGSNLYILEAAGLQSIARPGAPGQPPRVIQVTPAIARASAIIREGRLVRFDIDLLRSDGKDASLSADPARTFSAGRAQLHLLTRPDDSIDLAAKIEGAKIGEGYRPRLGSDLPLVDVRAKLVQSQFLKDLEQGRISFADAIEQWRLNGGMLSVDRLTLEWAGIKTELKGALTLDEGHRVNGELSGDFDAGALVGALTGGRFNLQVGSGGLIPIALRFKDGDIEAGLNSAFVGVPR